MKIISITLILLSALSFRTTVKSDFKNPEIERQCYITIGESDTYQVKKYYLQSIQDRVDYRNGQYIRYIDKNRSNTKLNNDYFLLQIKQGLYQKIKFSDIKNLKLIHRVNNNPECQILLNSGNTINGIYPPQGINLDYLSYSFLITKENGESLILPYKWLLNIEKDALDTERWILKYKELPENVTISNYDPYETVTIYAIDMKWITNKSELVSTVRHYGEHEPLNYLNFIKSEDEPGEKQTIKVNFSDIAAIEFFQYGEREIKMIDGTLLKGKINGVSGDLIKYFYGEVDENLIIFAFIFYDRFSLKFE